MNFSQFKYVSGTTKQLPPPNVAYVAVYVKEEGDIEQCHTPAPNSIAQTDTHDCEGGYAAQDCGTGGPAFTTYEANVKGA